MKVSEITPGSSKINVEAKVVEKQPVREVNTKFGQNTVCEAVIEDESGNIILVLWGPQANEINVGDNLKIENGFVKEWNGSMQLSVGKFGKITKV
ncbi:MAG TPA: OB-fold nucleic acid binding domain-containing protein [archaeon]|nr:OB-fold nucleic acid binding domain-containing protein [archaeon]